MKLICPLIICLTSFCYSQSFKIDNLGKEKLIRYNGAITANGIYYSGNGARQPFSYFLNGSLNFNIAGLYDVPLSFSYSNQKFDFPSPFKFNRLSLHPSYKWITTHIGDVSMSFSNYTLSGHQFSGAGFELSPQKPWKFSLLYGRFLKASEYRDEAPENLTAYKRMGYGFKFSYQFEKADIGISVFRAKDDEHSLKTPIPSSLELFPKENVAISVDSKINFLTKASLQVEYGVSGITEDIQLSAKRKKHGMLSFLLKENESTNYYKAIKATFSYPAGNGALGVGYERVDPDYRTFGAYYFNNDLENITLNANQSLFKEQLKIAFNGGLQRDNLNKAKNSELKRIVSSVNVDYTPNEKLGFNGTYSNFQSYTNIRNQFDYINQISSLENLDTLHYRQVSQSASFGASYKIASSEKLQKNISLNMSWQGSDNQQEGQTIEGGLTSSYNASLGYSINNSARALNVNITGNVSGNSTGPQKSLMLGPTLNISKQFFENRLKTNLTTAYNTNSINGEKGGSVYNIRIGGSYVLLEKHTFNLHLLNLFRKSRDRNTTEFTATLGYSYSFDNFKLKRSDPSSKSQESKEEKINFKYQGVNYSGTMPQVYFQLNEQRNKIITEFISKEQQLEFENQLDEVNDQKRAKDFEQKALVFLHNLYAWDEFNKDYGKMITVVINKIRKDMSTVDFQLEKRFLDQKKNIEAYHQQFKDSLTLDTGKKKQANEHNLELRELLARQKKLVGHRWMQEYFDSHFDGDRENSNDDLFRTFKNSEMDHAFMLYRNRSEKEVENYLEVRMIDFFYQEALKEVKPEDFDLKYIKNGKY